MNGVESAQTDRRRDGLLISPASESWGAGQNRRSAAPARATTTTTSSATSGDVQVGSTTCSTAGRTTRSSCSSVSTAAHGSGSDSEQSQFRSGAGTGVVPLAVTANSDSTAISTSFELKAGVSAGAHRILRFKLSTIFSLSNLSAGTVSAKVSTGSNTRSDSDSQAQYGDPEVVA